MANGDSALYIINVNISLNNMIEGFYLFLALSEVSAIFVLLFFFFFLSHWILVCET